MTPRNDSSVSPFASHILALLVIATFLPSPGMTQQDPASEPARSEFQAVHGDLVRQSLEEALAGREILVREVKEPTNEFDKLESRETYGENTRDNGRAWESPDGALGAVGVAGAGFTLDLAFESIDLAAASGVSGFFSTPPDTMGAVGPTEFFTAQNNTYRFHNKATGVSLGLDVADQNFWVPAVDPDNNGGGDPRVRFDRINDRWVVIAFDIGPGGNQANNRILIALSDGPTISGATVWTQYFFVAGSTVNGSADAGCFADYPMLGIDVNALYIGANMFNISSPGGCGNGGGTNTSVFVVPLAQLPGAGGSVNSITTAFTNLFAEPVWSPMPVDNFDPNASVGYIIGHDLTSDTNLKLGTISNPGGAAGTPTLAWADITISNKNDGFGNGVPYPGVPAPTGSGTAWGLDPLGFRPLGGAMVRNGRLWTAMSSSVNGPNGDLRLFPLVGDRHSVVFFEIDIATETLIQDGNVFDGITGLNQDPTHLYMGSVAINGQGHAVVGATANNTSEIAPSAAWASRLNSDPMGQFSEPSIYLAGTNTGNARHSFETTARRTRWGDYSQVTVDPCDDMTFYTIQEYQDTPAVFTGGNWATGVARILAPAPTFTGAAPSTVSGASTAVKVTGSGFYSTPATGMPSCRTDLAVTTSDPNLVVSTVTFNSPTSVTINFDASSASSGNTTVTITNPDGQAVDFMVAVTGADVIFDDGFETGDTTMWSSEVP